MMHNYGNKYLSKKWARTSRNIARKLSMSQTGQSGLPNHSSLLSPEAGECRCKNTIISSETFSFGNILS